MQLINDFYKIIDSSVSETEGIFRLRLNAAHAIYKSHFPGKPVTPGVCLCAIARELVEVMAEMSLQLTFVKNAKFLKVLSPDEYPEVAATVRHLTFTPAGTISAQVIVDTLTGETFAKLSIEAVRKDA